MIVRTLGRAFSLSMLETTTREKSAVLSGPDLRLFEVNVYFGGKGALISE
jgi:hypothetical protein